MKNNDNETASDPITLTQLRKNVYQIVDDVIATGKPLTLMRNGCLLVLSVQSLQPSKLARLTSRDAFDRLIAAGSVYSDLPLITRDKTILANLATAISAR